MIKYESVIHEFDPYFNYRVTERLTRVGPKATWNFFDDFTWYPLGRVVGGTMYPGLIFTAGLLWRFVRVLGLPVHVREICVFMGPLFSGLTALATYGLVREVKDAAAGLCAAALVATVPSYISRSVAGSYDLESIAIFALVFCFFLYVKALRTGSLAWSAALFLGYAFMVASWGGYSFVANILPIHALACIVAGRASPRLYAAFAPFVALGTLACLNVPAIGFNAVRTSEHFAGFFVLLALHAAGAAAYAARLLPPRALAAARRALLGLGAALGCALALALAAYVAGSPTLGWTGRSLSLLDPTYASKYIPIIASVSEHQPPTWSSYFTDLHAAVLLAPLGLVACFRPVTDASLFLALYAVAAFYFSGVMVRLMLVLAPAACCLAGIGLSEALKVLVPNAVGAYDGRAEGDGADAPAAAATGSATHRALLKSERRAAASAAGESAGEKKANRQRKRSTEDDRAGSADADADATASKPSKASPRPAPPAVRLPRDVSFLGLVTLGILLMLYVRHTVYVAAEMYSAPSVVLQTRRRDGAPAVLDDFREAYAWLSHNTPEDAKVASWWDYGYQTTGMANRTVIVDNNTWNNTHIATVGRAFALPERQSASEFRKLGVSYVFVLFGGFVGYPSDDVNKFLWMVRIGGGVYPDIKEANYLTKNGQYSVGPDAGKALLDCALYRLSYYRFGDAAPLMGLPKGYDRVRQQNVGLIDFDLSEFEEAFTSEHWMVRIYKVLDEPKRDTKLKRGETSTTKKVPIKARDAAGKLKA